MLLEEGWGYSTRVGGSCSTHNPGSVDPHPRGVGRLEDGARAEPASNHRREAAREPERTRADARPAEGEAGSWVRAPGPGWGPGPASIPSGLRRRAPPTWWGCGPG